MMRMTMINNDQLRSKGVGKDGKLSIGVDPTTTFFIIIFIE